MATIKIQRTSEYNNRMRNYQIYIDSSKVGTIANGETKDFIVSPGQHIVSARIDWCSSPDLHITVNENETKGLKVGGFKNGNWLMPLAGGIIAVHFVLKMTLKIDFVIFLVIPALILLIYYLTVGRKKYLTLTEADMLKSNY